MRKFFAILLLFFILFLVAFTFLPSYLSVSSNQHPIEITVPQGASLHYVSQLLYEEGIIKNAFWFRYKGKAASVDRNIKPGSYTLSPSMTLSEIFQLLQKGNLEKPIVLTIPEGFSLYQIANRVEELGLGSKEDFIASSKDYFDNQGYSFTTKDLYFEMEGYLYPDTYHFSSYQTTKDVLIRLASKMNEIFTQEYKDRAEELNLSIHEVLTLASLIEREAYSQDEKTTISGVIHNRLSKNMLLQIDATVIYGIGEGKEHMNRVLYADLEKNNAFNTYKNLGLPPGPIASPSKSSIHAALYPDEHDYIYYVLGKKGHVFAKTYQEHLKNVAEYRQLVNQR